MNIGSKKLLREVASTFCGAHRWFRLSPQYHKAWHAGFPTDLWPAEEEESEDRTVFLKLKDGTRLLAYEPAYSRPSTGKIVPVNIVAGQPKQSE